jgi:DNA repair protein RadD
MNRELWPHQSQALLALRQTIGQGVRRVMLSAPTGSGKTVLAAAIVEGALAKRNRVCFVISNLSLVDQTVEAFYREGIRDVGVIQSNHFATDWSRPVQVASIQTIKSRGVFPEANVVIIDEAHVLHQCHKEWMQHPDWGKVPFIGLSATPYTKGLAKYFETMISVATTQELIDKGVLCPFKVFATGHPDLSKVRTVAGDYHEGELSTAMQKGDLTADIVKTYKEIWGKGKTLFFGVDCDHAQTVQARFEEAGIRCGYQDAKTPMDERRDIKRRFHNGDLEIVSNVGTITTGADWNCHCLILGRPTKSEILLKQIIGRALRIAPDKSYALILDHSDTTQNLGFVTDIEHTHLDGGATGHKQGASAPRAKPLPRPCPSCASLTPRLARVCQECGFKLPLASGVTEQDGVLVEMVPGQINMQKKGAPRFYTMQDKRRFHAELLWYQRDKAKSPKWTLAFYRQRFGEWPPRGWILDEPMGTSFEVAQWIKSRNIKFARAKAKAETMQFKDAAE